MSEEETNLGLIPGLVDDMALHCLRRLSLPDQAVARAVSRTWREAISNPEYLRSRAAQGLAEPWLFVLAFHKVSGKIQWQALHPERRRYHIIPSMPCKERVCPPGFGCASIATAGVLLVCGGLRSDVECPMDAVLKYETFSNRWSAAGHMGTPRSFFAAGAIDGRVYAAGGSSSDTQKLNSAEAYDLAEDTWRPVASMGVNVAHNDGALRYDTAVLDGKLHVTEGWSWPFYYVPRGQIYDPKKNLWEDMSLGMREGWTGLSFVIGKILFVISEHGNRLKFYDGNSDSWIPVDGPPISSHLQRPFSVSTIDGKLYVVSRSLHVAVGTITLSVDSKGVKVASVEWEVITAPESFSDFVPSSSQVLYA